MISQVKQITGSTQGERASLETNSLPIRETSLYISDMILDLRNMAKAAGIKSLQGMLELCYYEAFATAHKVALPEGEHELLASIGEDARRAETVGHGTGRA